mgnify:CR=1 FL=1
MLIYNFQNKASNIYPNLFFAIILGKESVLRDKNRISKESSAASTAVSGTSLSLIEEQEDEVNVGTQAMLKSEPSPTTTFSTKELMASQMW